MANPLKSSTVSTEVVGDGLGVFDREQKRSYVLNATSALVFQHCDGQTSPRQLAELLRQKLNVPQARAEELTRLALEELQRAHLLQTGAGQIPPPEPGLSRRQTLTGLASAGLSLLLLPMVTALAEAHGGGNDHGQGGHDDDHDGHDGHDDDDDGHGGHGDDDDDDHDHGHDHDGDNHGGHKLIPLVECVDQNSNGTYTAHFGYLNQTHHTINIPLGPNNQFVPGQPDRGQPTAFLPGEHLNVFSVIFDGNAIKWSVKASGDRRHQVVASSGSERCPTTPRPTTTTRPPTTTLPPTTTRPPTTTMPPTTTRPPTTTMPPTTTIGF
jgi:hypothetical protein